MGYEGGKEAATALENTAARERQSQDRQEHRDDQNERGSKEQEQKQRRWSATDKIKYEQDIRIDTLNCHGLVAVTKREQIEHIMDKKKLDILLRQETHIPHMAEEKKNQPLLDILNQRKRRGQDIGRQDQKRRKKREVRR